MNEVQVLRDELSRLSATLDAYFELVPQDQFNAWRKAKRIVAETASGDTLKPTATTSDTTEDAPLVTLEKFKSMEFAL